MSRIVCFKVVVGNCVDFKRLRRKSLLNTVFVLRSIGWFCYHTDRHRRVSREPVRFREEEIEINVLLTVHLISDITANMDVRVFENWACKFYAMSNVIVGFVERACNLMQLGEQFEDARGQLSH